MDNTRLFLVVALSFIAVMLWDAWQRDYGAEPPPRNIAAPTAPTIDAPIAEANDVPSIDTDAPPPIQAPSEALGVAVEASPSDTVSVRTDVFELRINTLGGGIVFATLPKYPVSRDTPDDYFELLGQNSERLFIHQGGLKGSGSAPNHRAQYTANASSYQLADGAEELLVDLRWQSDDGLHVTKQYVFTRGSYDIGLRYFIDNQGSEPWTGRAYEQLQRREPQSRRGLIYTFTGAALSTPEKRYEKFDYDDLNDQPLDIEVSNGWIAILEHYFVSALIPPAQNLSHYYSLILDEQRYAVGYWSPGISISPGASEALSSTIFVGPKLQDELAHIAPGLELTVDFGVLWFIAKPLFALLEFIRNLTGNWGWAIILLTCLLKLVFYPLSAAGYRSMAKMRTVQPRMMAIKERHGGDRARMNQAMMELYKEEKINPLGGCLPILVQIPVFIALYWVLLESVELRQAPFALWLDDLSSKDPYFVLPLIMGISMWFQQKLNPAPMDPVQQKVMQILPFAFTIFFMFFPSGLVLYWVVNNILSIAQQWMITRSIEQSTS